MAARPSGTITFLFTDIEGSTRMWDDDSTRARDAVARHDESVRACFEQHDGYVFATGGDGFAVAFGRAADAIAAAIAAQVALQDDELPAVRMGVHTGEAEERGGDYFGAAVNRAARLMSIAHGGQILVSAAVREVAHAVELRSLGVHRLRDLSRPEQVFQVVDQGLRDDFPPLRSLDALPTNLRAQLTTFVGRDQDMTKVAALLDEHRLVTLTGVGGVGKTRVALQVAGEVLPRFADGAWLAELASAQDAESMDHVVANALGAQQRSGRTYGESIVEFLRSKSLLLVLDNCEHLTEVAGALAERILWGAPEVRILVTSREGLGIEGEHVVPLRSLPVDDAERLFVDRAQAARDGFDIDDENAAAVAEICRRLDGIPLAIELAAARVVAMSPADIAAHLDERFRLLTGGRRTAVERHQTLRATVDWSYTQLTEHERRIFVRLGVFSGSFDADAAWHVVGHGEAGQWDVVDAIASLVSKSLVVAEDRDNSVRYELLETLRQYALERLDEEGETDDWRRRHARFYSERAEALAWRLISPDELEAREGLVADLDNVRAAVGWTLDRDDRDDVALGLRVVAMLNDEPNMAPGLGIGAWSERAMTKLDGADDWLRACVLAAAAYEAHHRGDHELAIKRAEVSVAFGAARGVPSPGTGFAALSMVNALLGHSREAVDAVILGEKELRRIDPSDVQIARFYGGSVAALANAQQMSHARVFAELGMDYARRSGNPSVLATCYFGIATTRTTQDPDAALAAFDAAIQLGREGTFSTITGPALYQAAYLRLQKGDERTALQDLRTAVVLLWENGQEPQLDGAFGFASEMLALTGNANSAFVIVGAIVGGALQRLRAMPVPPERDPAATLRRAREQISDEERKTAMQQGAELSYPDLVQWLIATLDELIDVPVR